MTHFLTAVTSLLLAFVLFGCEAQPRGPVGQTEPVEMIHEWSGNDAGLDGPEIYLVQSREELEALGSRELINVPVDFKQHMLVVLAAGEQPTGGYWVEITGIQRSGKTLYVQGLFNAPGEDMMVTQALTYPYHAVAVERVSGAVLSSHIRSVEGQPMQP